MTADHVHAPADGLEPPQIDAERARSDAPEPRVRPPRLGLRLQLGRRAVLAVQLGLLLVLLASWQWGVSDAAAPYFSRPSLVAARLATLIWEPTLYRDIAITLKEIALGYGLGAVVGLALGFALGRSAFLSATFQPYIMAFYSIPKIALAPVFVVWLGLGIASKVAVVFLSSFFLVFFNTYSGLIAINEELVSLARLIGASWPQTLLRVILPASAAQIFIGLRTAVPYAVIGAVIGEYIGSNEGLGYFILYASQTYDAPALYSGIALLVAIVYLLNLLLGRIERRVIRWREAGKQAVQL